jgi:hypothetical protein
MCALQEILNTKWIFILRMVDVLLLSLIQGQGLFLGIPNIIAINLSAQLQSLDS